jgi:hypothetical protein
LVRFSFENLTKMTTAGSEVVINDVNFEPPSGKFCDYDSAGVSTYDCFSFTNPSIRGTHDMGHKSAVF